MYAYKWGQSSTYKLVGSFKDNIVHEPSFDPQTPHFSIFKIGELIPLDYLTKNLQASFVKLS